LASEVFMDVTVSSIAGYPTGLQPRR